MSSKDGSVSQEFRAESTGFLLYYLLYDHDEVT